MQGALSMVDRLSQAAGGDERSMAELLPLVYGELKLLAARQLGRENSGGRAHTLQPTALVHEAFMKMVGSEDREWSGRDHFMAVAAKAMRQVLVDHSRRKNADKRGGGAAKADISVEGLNATDPAADVREMRVLELDELLDELGRASPRAARVAEMRLFGGMDLQQVARVLGVSRMTTHRDWLVARAWLAAKMQDDAS